MELNNIISMSISKSSYTIHSFAQQLNIKLKVLESYIDGSEKPDKKTITKMNKYLNNKIPYNEIKT